MSYLVTEKAKRPASTKNECFYCNRAIGAEHRLDCVLIKRKAKISVSFELEIDVPAHWDENWIETHYNEGTYCASNFVDKLSEMAVITEDGMCRCTCDICTVSVLSIAPVVELKE